MSLKATANALDAELPPFDGHDGDPVAKLVLVLIADYADEDEVGELDIGHIAERAGLTFVETERAIDRLHRAGFFDHIQHVDDHRLRIVGGARGN